MDNLHLLAPGGQFSPLQTFDFRGSTVRVLVHDSDPWWIAADVCAVLDLDRTATRRLDDDEKGVRSMHTPSGDQEMTVINESGLYSLVLGSRKPEAKAFKKWITSEVIPAIRKTGSYSVGVSPAEMLLHSAQLLVDQERKIQRLQTQVSQIPTIAAKVDALEEVQREAAESLIGIPAPATPVPGISMRALVNRVVRDYCFSKGHPHNLAWRRLNQEFRDRHHTDLMARRQGKQTILDVAEDLGVMDDLYAVAHLLFARAS